jgi:hypothetical protein
MIPQLILICVFVATIPRVIAESGTEKSVHGQDLNAEIFQIMEKDRGDFIEDSREPRFIAFVVEVKSKLDRKVFRAIQGKIPSDALSYIADFETPGFYVVGILRPSAQQAFNGSRDTRKYVLPIIGDQWGTEQIMKADLSQLIDKTTSTVSERIEPNQEPRSSLPSSSVGSRPLVPPDRRSRLNAAPMESMLTKLAFDDPSDGYFLGFLKVKSAEEINSREDSIRLLQMADSYFQEVKNRFPDWKTEMVNARIEKTREALAKLSTLDH